MELYNYFRSSAWFRVRIALALKGLDYDYKAVHLQKSEQLQESYASVSASRLALQKAGLKAGDMDVIEANEAFAAQACAVSKELDMDPAKVNPNGSGISLGHPVGATGVILATKLIHELQRTRGRYGLTTMCIGGGQGIAIVYERV